jgi:phage terminase small subunit
MPKSQDPDGAQEAPTRQKKLTERQKRFVQEYVIDCNATQAAIRAGFSKKNPDDIGAQLLSKTHIKEAVDEKLAAKAKQLDLSVDRILAEYMRYAFVDHPKSLVTDFTSDRLKALEKLGNHLGMWKEKDDGRSGAENFRNAFAALLGVTKDNT